MMQLTGGVCEETSGNHLEPQFPHPNVVSLTHSSFPSHAWIEIPNNKETEMLSKEQPLAVSPRALHRQGELSRHSLEAH